MAVLRDFEKRLEGAVEGFFARTFKSGLQPVELAKALQRYAANYQQVGLEGVSVPNIYRFQLNPADYKRFSGYEASLHRELAEVVVATAAERSWTLKGPVRIELVAVDSVRVGTYELRGKAATTPPADADAGVSAEAVPNDDDDAPFRPPLAPSVGAHGGAVGDSDAQAPDADAPAAESPESDLAAPSGDPAAEPAPRASAAPPAPPPPVAAPADVPAGAAVPTAFLPRPVVAPQAYLHVLGKERHSLSGLVVLGRLPECDITIDDPSVSRRHARISYRDGTWRLEDLGSTNGVKINGERVAVADLTDGDRIALGTVQLAFSLSG